MNCDTPEVKEQRREQGLPAGRQASTEFTLSEVERGRNDSHTVYKAFCFNVRL